LYLKTVLSKLLLEFEEHGSRKVSNLAKKIVAVWTAIIDKQQVENAPNALRRLCELRADRALAELAGERLRHRFGKPTSAPRVRLDGVELEVELEYVPPAWNAQERIAVCLAASFCSLPLIMQIPMVENEHSLQLPQLGEYP
jgi:hypothetical protein